MPSRIRQFKIRNSGGRQKLEALNINADRFAAAVLNHAIDQVEDGVCPICQKPFEECEYFQRLESE